MATTQTYNEAVSEVGNEAGNRTSSRANFLRRSIQWDAEIMTLFGIALLIFAGPIASFMGITNPMILRIGGLIMVLYDGGRLLWAMRTNPVDPRLAKLSLYGNAIWAIVSIPVLALELLPLSNGGWWIMAFLADFAALFAILQWYGMRKSG